LDCHAVHDTELAADQRCRACHGAGATLTSAGSTPAIARTATFAGHDKCVTCHKPHTFTRDTAAACTDCHSDLPVLASTRVRKHAQCASCHDPHDASPTAAERRCAKCHKTISPDHPPLVDVVGARTTQVARAVPSKGNHPCVGCHPIHEPAVVTATLTAVACSSCHTAAASDTAFHAGDTACAACHQAHDFALRPGDTTVCRTCHAGEQRATSRARAGGHRDCRTCHTGGAHTPSTAPAACASCHTEQRATATAGHTECRTCHDPHAGALLATAARCQSCHTEQANAHHARIDNGCNACHRVHGPGGVAKPPTCATCHDTARLPTLHKLKDHQTCGDCHDVHERTPKAPRATCTTAGCHTQVKGMPVAQHEPAATTCVGCHPFRGGATLER
jgi:hypothetical protein